MTDKAEDDRKRMAAVLEERGEGSKLRGWRRELDLDGSLHVGFQEFCTAAKRLGMGDIDALLIFGEDSPDTLVLEELLPIWGGLVRKFRIWIEDKFGGPGEMFAAFEPPNSDAGITRQDFVSGCEENGFDASSEDIHELFNLCDYDAFGGVSLEEVMFLETNPERRAGALLKLQLKGEHQHQKQLLNVYHEGVRLSLPDSHRMSQRVWHAAALEKLPAVVCQRRKDRLHELHIRMARARSIFLEHIQKMHGNEVRAWRNHLDPEERFFVTKAQLSKYCRSADLRVVFGDLWKAMDRDEDGLLRMEEIGPKPAAALARLQAWARRQYGCCSFIWDVLEDASVRTACLQDSRWASNKKIHCGSFLKLLRNVGCAFQPDEGALLCAALDSYGAGFVAQSDLGWLDRWKAPAWLTMQPDPAAWAELRDKLLQAHGPPLRAWRRALDTDDSNQVCWVEFLAACAKVGFRGNAGGAWRCLDRDISGTITLHEFDYESAELLASFKELIEDLYGSVEFAFRSMDSDGSGALMYTELRRACKRFNWNGDVRLIFKCLDIDTAPGKRTLSYKELAFLDSWAPNQSRQTVTGPASPASSRCKMEGDMRRSASCTSMSSMSSVHPLLGGKRTSKYVPVTTLPPIGTPPVSPQKCVPVPYRLSPHGEMHF